MEDMIKRIVEMDQRARAITEEALSEKLNCEQDINERKGQIRDEYLSKARERIEQVRVKETAFAEECRSSTQQKHTGIARRLDEIYRQNGDRWVDTIVERVLTRD